MPTLAWTGAPPPASVSAFLQARGIQIETAARADESGDRVALLYTASATRTLKPPSGPGRWIWVCRDDVSETRRLQAITAGAYDVVSLRDPDADTTVARRLDELWTALPPVPAAAHLVLGSAVSRRLVAQVARVAPTSMPVLVTGETGTGKEVMARLIHAWSPRQKRPFIPINCAAIPNELMEAELFGYARGAFSGAVQRYDGQIVAAEGGTVFLDEIDETPLETQVKLLRVLEDRVVSRLGENVWHEVDFRLIAATNRDLHALIEANLFGADLYERLAIVTIALSPLRDRLEDLPTLARHFMERFAAEQGRAPVRSIRPDARRVLEAYAWPGNIRELRNVLYETLVYKRAGDEILPSDLPKRILTTARHAEASALVDRSRVAHKIARGTMKLKQEVAALQRAALDEALRLSGGNAAEAARLLGEVGRGTARDPGSTVRAMMRRLTKTS